jgi:hypothetical protein
MSIIAHPSPEPLTEFDDAEWRADKFAQIDGPRAVVADEK